MHGEGDGGGGGGGETRGGGGGGGVGIGVGGGVVVSGSGAWEGTGESGGAWLGGGVSGTGMGGSGGVEVGPGVGSGAGGGLGRGGGIEASGARARRGVGEGGMDGGRTGAEANAWIEIKPPPGHITSTDIATPDFIAHEQLLESNLPILNSNQVLQRVSAIPVSHSSAQNLTSTSGHTEGFSKAPGKIVYQIINVPSNQPVDAFSLTPMTPITSVTSVSTNQMLPSNQSKFVLSKLSPAKSFTQQPGQGHALNQDQGQLVLQEVGQEQAGQIQTLTRDLGQSAVVLDTGQQQQQQQQQGGYQTLMLSYSDALQMVGQLTDNHQ
jgi:hypothetical protein